MQVNPQFLPLVKWGLPCLRRVLLPDPVPQYLESTLLCRRRGARRAQPSLLSTADTGSGQLLVALCKAPSCSLSRHLPAGEDRAVTCTEPYLRWQNTGSALSSATSFPCPTGTDQKQGLNNGCAFTLQCALKSRGEKGICRPVQCLMWVTFLGHFIMGTQLQQIPGNLIPEINVEELKQQYLSSASDCQFRGGSESP